MAFTAAHSAALASWRFLSSSFVLNISWTHCRLLPEAAWSHRANILMLKILTTWSAPALASWTQARSSHPPWPARPGLGLQRSLFTVRVWLWLWWVVKESHKHAVDSRQHKSPLAHCMDVSTILFHFSSACPNISRDEYTLANFKSNTGRQINVHQSCFSQLAAIHGKCVLVLLRWVTYG